MVGGTMTRFSTLLLGAVSLVAISTSARAADVVVVDVPAGYNWSGFYVGAGIGAGANVAALDLLSFISFDGIGGEGVFGELTIGYDHMISPRVLFGALADVHYSAVETKLGPDESASDTYGFDLGLRAGYLLTPSTLGYVLGGYAWQKGEIDFPDGDLDSDRDGYFVGVGVETAIASNWTLKTEYRFTQFGNDNIFEDLGVPDGFLNSEVSSHTFRVSANYRFGMQNGGGAAFEVPAYNWTGFYLGVAGAAGAAVTELSEGGGSFDGIGGEGVRGEISAGYDHDFGSFVAGIMVDAHYGNGKTEFDLNFGGPSIGFDAKADYGFDVLARAGMKVNESTLAYVLGGYSWQNFEADVSFTGLGSATIAEWDVNGFTIGGGLETAVTSNVTVGFEYRYTQFEDADLDLDGLDVETSMQTARITAKYKFN